jgi:hypothetical protein
MRTTFAICAITEGFCMRHGSGHGNRTVGVILQIAAMAMLLCMPHVPLPAPALAVHSQPRRCAMDHRLCGCAPERIASRTCCCFRNMKSVETPVRSGYCDLQAKHHEQPDLDKDTPPASHRLSCLPCGQGPQMISHATSEMKYLPSARAPLPTYSTALHCSPLRGDCYLGPSLEPPVPPPKISIFV